MNFSKFFFLFFLLIVVFSVSSFFVFAIQVCSFEDSINFCKQFSNNKTQCTSSIESANFGCSWLAQDSCIPTAWTQTVEDKCICVQDGGMFEVNVGDACDSSLLTANYCGNGVINPGEQCDLLANSGDSGTCQLSPSNNICTSNCECWSFCGDGIYQAINSEGTTEECDQNSFSNSNLCSDFNSVFTSGNLACRNDCSIDSSACIAEIPSESNNNSTNNNNNNANNNTNSNNNSTNNNNANNSTNNNNANNSTNNTNNSSFLGNITNPLTPNNNQTNSNLLGSNSTINQSQNNLSCGDGIFESDIEECEISAHCGAGFSCEFCSCIEISTTPNLEFVPVIIPPTCGNFAIDSGEQCDGVPTSALYSWDCTPIEVCTTDCQCTSADLACGNGVLDGGELCDISAPNGNSCSGDLVCNGRCSCIEVQLSDGGLPKLSKGSQSANTQSSRKDQLSSAQASLASIDSPEALRSDSNGKSLFFAIGLLLVGIIILLVLFFHFHGVKKTPVPTDKSQSQIPVPNQ